MTTEANDVVKPFHDRMPVILNEKAADGWLKPGDMTEETAAKILMPAPKTFLIEFEVSTIVNSAKTDKPACIEPIVSG